VAAHPLQESVDGLVDYLTDARHIHNIVTDLNAAAAKRRRDQGNATGAGQPPREHKSLNRAVVVASVGALEAFTEDLALRAMPLVPGANVSDSWFDIAGRRGMIQTPNAWNLAKMMWSYFRYDPRSDWNFLVTTAWSEVGTGTNWRGTTTQYQGSDAANALDAMVKVRHGFAHQDRTNAPVATPGIVALTSSGKLSLQSHHAFNSMSLVAQVALQMTHGLEACLSAAPSAPLRWKKSMTAGGLERLLEGTPVATQVQKSWVKSPW
jgi:hypothetical protein